MRVQFVFRVRVIAGVCFIVALVLIARLYTIQVMHGDAYAERALDQHVAPSSHQLSRGEIYFTGRDGSLVSAATIRSGYTVALSPERVTDANSTYEALSGRVPIERAPFDAAAARVDDPYEELLRRADEAVGQSLINDPIPGVSAYRERWRYYPGDTLAAHEIGFMGYNADGTTVSGQYGLERAYNHVLVRPESGRINFFSDIFLNVGARVFGDTAGSGGDVVTSIEPTVQAFLEQELAAYNARWHASRVGGVVMDPKTGAIIAMASLPTYNPNDIKNADPDALSNVLVERVYEFGSTMKPITVAAALDAGAITPASTYTDRGTITLDEKTISNFDGKARGVVSMQEVLSQSLNTGIAHVVQKMGTEKLRSYFERFGITEETGIDLPSEASPLVDNLSSPRVVEYVTAGFGQGVAITPIAMTRALAALANHGSVPSPHVGLEIKYPGGIRTEVGWSPPRRALRPESAEAVTSMLVRVVDTALRGGVKKVPEMSIAAKTGTAQIANPNGGGYYTDRYLHSFFGYFPAYDARFLIFLFAVEPQGAQYASETLTDPFFTMTNFLTSYYQVQPDRATALNTP